MLSIIIPCYNNVNSIKNNIMNIINFCDAIDGEIIIVNDGSTDDIDLFIKNIKHKRINYIKQDNKGVSSARNVGINKATKGKILFLDSDDHINFDKLLKNIDLINDYDLLYWDTIKCYKKKKIKYVTHEEKNIDDIIIALLKRKYYFFIGSFIISTIIAKKILFNTSYKYGEDLKFIYDSFSMIKNTKKINEVYLYYIQREDSAMYKFNANRLDSIKALTNITSSNVLKFKSELNDTIQYDKKIILKSFIRANSLRKILSNLRKKNEITLLIKDVFGNKIIYSKLKFLAYTLIYKIHILIK